MFPSAVRKSVVALMSGTLLTFPLSTAEARSTPILMKRGKRPQVSVSEAQTWARSNEATRVFRSLARLYWRHAGRRAGVRPTVAYAQAAKETGFGRFGGQVSVSHRNPCGLRTTSGKGFKRFSSWRQGVKAHIDHLALYAGAKGYPRKSTPDPRHFRALYGEAPMVEALGGRWAPSPGYGRSIVRHYLRGLLATNGDAS
jgi:N-acetylmuramoyl-L-alanine amidase